MESLINKLVTKVTESNRENFFTWLNDQLGKKHSLYNTDYSLLDVDESKIVNCITNLMENYQFTTSEITSHISLIASPLQANNEMDVLIEVQPTFFSELLLNENIVNVKTGVVRAKDTFVKSGSFNNIEFTQRSSNTDPIVHAFISITLHTKDEKTECLNVFFNKDECEEIVRSYSEKKYNGHSPFDCCAWESVIISALFERLYTEEVFIYLREYLTEKATRKLALVKEYSVHRLNQHIPTCNKVYTTKGKLIGHKIKTVNSTISSEHQPPKLSLVKSTHSSKDCQPPVTENNEYEEGKDYYNTWGEF